jgi:hypothetical protein
MINIIKVINTIGILVILALIVVAGVWTFGVVGGVIGLLLGCAVIAVAIRLLEAEDADSRFDRFDGMS